MPGSFPRADACEAQPNPCAHHGDCRDRGYVDCEHEADGCVLTTAAIPRGSMSSRTVSTSSRMTSVVKSMSHFAVYVFSVANSRCHSANLQDHLAGPPEQHISECPSILTARDTERPALSSVASNAHHLHVNRAVQSTSPPRTTSPAIPEADVTMWRHLDPVDQTEPRPGIETSESDSLFEAGQSDALPAIQGGFSEVAVVAGDGQLDLHGVPAAGSPEPLDAGQNAPPAATAVHQGTLPAHRPVEAHGATPVALEASVMPQVASDVDLTGESDVAGDEYSSNNSDAATAPSSTSLGPAQEWGVIGAVADLNVLIEHGSSRLAANKCDLNDPVRTKQLLSKLTDIIDKARSNGCFANGRDAANTIDEASATTTTTGESSRPTRSDAPSAKHYDAAGLAVNAPQTADHSTRAEALANASTVYLDTDQEKILPSAISRFPARRPPPSTRPVSLKSKLCSSIAGVLGRVVGTGTGASEVKLAPSKVALGKRKILGDEDDDGDTGVGVSARTKVGREARIRIE